MDEENSVGSEDNLAPWETPALTTLDAEDAELGGAPGADATVLLS